MAVEYLRKSAAQQYRDAQFELIAIASHQSMQTKARTTTLSHNTILTFRYNRLIRVMKFQFLVCLLKYNVILNIFSILFGVIWKVLKS